MTKGYDKAFGARLMARVIQDHIKRPLADELLFGKLLTGGVVKVKLDGDKLAFDITPNAIKPKSSDSKEPKEPVLVE
jgi:ATP-dependent Clp protease ATP-binding subunit ClpA